jgi:hypothetical protein
MADRVERLREAAQARHEATLRRAESVLQRMAKRGDPVTFNRVAETAGVSRSWPYRQPKLRQEIDRLREASASRPGLPSPERASTDSLRQQLHSYREEFRRGQGGRRSCRGHTATNREPGTARTTLSAPRRRPHGSRHTTLITAVEDMSTTRKMLLHNRSRLRHQAKRHSADVAVMPMSGRDVLGGWVNGTGRSA